jgi:hypothetical protein
VNLMMDTNALSSFAEGGPEVTAGIPNLKQWPIPLIGLGEHRFGVRRLELKRFGRPIPSTTSGSRRCAGNTGTTS